MANIRARIFAEGFALHFHGREREVKDVASMQAYLQKHGSSGFSRAPTTFVLGYTIQPYYRLHWLPAMASYSCSPEKEANILTYF